MISLNKKDFFKMNIDVFLLRDLNYHLSEFVYFLGELKWNKKGNK